jgi:hypothetical protein
VAGQGQHFFYDEWAFVGGKLDALPFPDRYLVPHNEHWSMVPVLVYRTLRATVGLGSYWPYLGLLLLLHLGVTHVLWRLMIITGSKPIVATALAAVFSVLGAAAEDLVWAFQIGFVGSSLIGVSAIYLAITGCASWRKAAVLTCLATASLATSGVGLTYLIVVPFTLAWRRRRQALLVFSLPLLVYIVWYAMYERSFLNGPPASETLPVMVGAFVVVGLTAALTSYFGFKYDATSLLFVVPFVLPGLTLACRDWWTGRTLAGRALLAMSLGAVLFFGSVGLARAALGPGYATTSRYVYVAIALLLPGLAMVISRGADWHPRLMKAIVPVAIVVAVSNIFQLLTYAAETRQDNNTSRRILVAASDLVRSNSPIFADQSPEPRLAPDLTTADLSSNALDNAFEDSIPESLDRLTASLNLQIRVAPDHGTAIASTCGTNLATIMVSTTRETTPTFAVTADAPIAFTLHHVGTLPAERVMLLAKGTYRINSVLDAADLTIESRSPFSRLAKC